jgi:P-loop containing NTP hydrolase pore-1
MLSFMKQDLVENNKLSALQLESIVYACQRHEQFLPDGSRCGFFIGDGIDTCLIRLLYRVHVTYAFSGSLRLVQEGFGVAWHLCIVTLLFIYDT